MFLRDLASASLFFRDFTTVDFSQTEPTLHDQPTLPNEADVDCVVTSLLGIGHVATLPAFTSVTVYEFGFDSPDPWYTRFPSGYTQ